ncbi:MAG: histidine phosphatase family protein [Bacillota bacterium]
MTLGQGKLYVVRNGAVKREVWVRPEDWRLSAEGVLLTIPIAEASFWSQVSALYYGPEISSAQTARIITRRWQMRAVCEWDLREWVQRPTSKPSILRSWWPLEIQASLPVAPMEDFPQAQARVVSCLQRLAAKEQGKSFAVVMQGRILMALFSRLLGRRLGDAEYLALRSPDLSVVNLQTWRVDQGFLSSMQYQDASGAIGRGD